VNDQLPIPAALTPVKGLWYPFGWVGPTGCLNVLEKRGMSWPSRDKNPWSCSPSSIHYTDYASRITEKIHRLYHTNDRNIC